MAQCWRIGQHPKDAISTRDSYIGSLTSLRHPSMHSLEMEKKTKSLRNVDFDLTRGDLVHPFAIHALFHFHPVGAADFGINHET